MESPHHRKNSSSDDKFSFPTLPPADPQTFLFGSSLTSNSPADHLFSDGKLLPHSFPPSITTAHLLPRSGIDSSLSSRSNSYSGSSRSGSGCSSARTSTSDASAAAERKIFCRHAAKIAAKTATAARGDEYIWNQYQAKKPVLIPHYGSSRRWQFITPAPALRHQNSSRPRKGKFNEREYYYEKKRKNSGSCSGGFFRWMVSGCKGCHAMPPTPAKDLCHHVGVST